MRVTDNLDGGSIIIFSVMLLFSYFTRPRAKNLCKNCNTLKKDVGDFCSTRCAKEFNK